MDCWDSPPLPSPCVRARPSSPTARPAKLSIQSRRDGLCDSVCLSRFPPADPSSRICHTPASQAASPHRVPTSSRLLKTQPIDAVGTIDRSSMLADERHDRSIIEGADRHWPGAAVHFDRTQSSHQQAQSPPPAIPAKPSSRQRFLRRGIRSLTSRNPHRASGDRPQRRHAAQADGAEQR